MEIIRAAGDSDRGFESRGRGEARGGVAGASIAQARAALAAPLLMDPAVGSSHATNPELRWSAIAGASAYRVQVAVDARFADSTHQVDTVATHHVASTDLDPGTLHWRGERGGSVAEAKRNNRTAPGRSVRTW